MKNNSSITAESNALHKADVSSSVFGHLMLNIETMGIT